ncbi:MAG: tripartite tricarboxylate transporter substrate binding protein [Ectothiorhodospiraceae bacterium]|nr:tripartite tricarboxylate transporter substrate binding protein [Chromatiales bacterium]MCP5156369.1 tripartite tricarboxylate transporter substrate binding protein [Ectothiorhodospiraceae bacterium]
MKGPISLLRRLGVAVAAFAAISLSAHAYPDKPIRLIVPFPPGGSNDIVGRLVAAKLGEVLGQQIIIENKPGAGGTVGTAAAARAEPDGYTLLVASVAYAYAPALRKLKYDPVKDFVTVGTMGTGPVAMSVNPEVPVASVQELVDYIKANPGKLTYSTAGIGSFQHLSSELFRSMTGADMIHVPFKGGGPAMQSTIAGETNVNIGTLVQQIPQIQAGRLKVLGVGSSERNGALPDVPTIDEAGVPGYLASNWWGILAPTGTPEAIVDQVSEALAKVVESDDIKKALSDQGAAAMKMNPAEFAAFMTAEMEKWAKVVKDAGIEPN